MARLSRSFKISAVKAFTWRFVASSITWCVTYVATEDTTLATQLALADSVVKILGYYMHEVLWIVGSRDKTSELVAQCLENPKP